MDSSASVSSSCWPGLHSDGLSMAMGTTRGNHGEAAMPPAWPLAFCHEILDAKYTRDFPGDSVVNSPPANAGDTGDVDSILGLGRSPGRGNGNPWTEEPDGLQSMGGHEESDTTDWLTEHTKTHTHAQIHLSLTSLYHCKGRKLVWDISQHKLQHVLAIWWKPPGELARDLLLLQQ